MNKLASYIKGLAPAALALLQQADWALVLFLCGLVQIKLAVKLAAIVAYTVYAFLKKRFSKQPLPTPAFFFFSIPVVGLLSSLVAGNFGFHSYLYAYGYTATLWLVAGAGFLLLYYTALSSHPLRLAGSIKLFILINLLCCGYQYVMMAIEAHSAMPYWLHDKLLLYGVSSGDRIYGIFMDSSHVNAAANGLLMLFFIFRQQLKWAAVCAFVIALCTSNMVFLVLLALLVSSYFAAKDKAVKTTVLKAGALYLAFYLFISPENIKYAAELLSGNQNTNKEYPQPYAWLPFNEVAFNEEHIKADLIALKQQDAINRLKYPNQPLDTSYTIALLGKWYGPQIPASIHQPMKKGKAMALVSTLSYAFSGSKAFALGAGPACFSSKTAFKITGLGLQGNYPEEKIFIAKPFFENHFLIELCYLAKPVAMHSIANKPGSVYHQLLGEYGIVGILLFCYCYLYFFYRKSKGSAGKIILLTTMFLLFAVDYWFEMLSLTFIFEFLILIPATIKKGNDPTSGHGVNASL